MGAEQFLKDWDQIVKVQNRSTLEGSPVAQAIVSFMENKDEHAAMASELHRALEREAQGLSIDTERDPTWPKSPKWLWRKIKEVLPLLTALGIEAVRKDTRRGSEITLKRVPEGGDRGGNRVATEPKGDDKGGDKDVLSPSLPPDTYADSASGGDSGNRNGHSGSPLSQTGEEEGEKRPLKEGQKDTPLRGPKNVATVVTAKGLKPEDDDPWDENLRESIEAILDNPSDKLLMLLEKNNESGSWEDRIAYAVGEQLNISAEVACKRHFTGHVRKIWCEHYFLTFEDVFDMFEHADSNLAKALGHFLAESPNGERYRERLEQISRAVLETRGMKPDQWERYASVVEEAATFGDFFRGDNT